MKQPGAFAAAWAVLALTALPTARAADPAVAAARAHRERQGPAILGEFAELLAIPNVPQDPEGQRRTATWIRDALSRRGVAAELLESAGVPPVIVGRLDSAGATRTLGIYVHYDGQPVDPALWSSPPFEPVLLTRAREAGGQARPFPVPGERIDPEWRIYARSAGDDKAPVPAILAALDALVGAGIQRTSNLVFFFEGEEEAGSTNLGAYLERARDRLADIDLWLICDGPVHQSRRPQLVFGVRGYTGLDITVYGAERYLHSGHYGNWAPNPAFGLARLLSSMKGADGNVSIEGWNASNAPPSEGDRRAIEAVPSVDVALREELGLRETEAGNAPLMERLLLPSLNVRGLASGSIGATAQNVIPTFAEASIDVRLVKGNDPEAMLDLIEAHIRRQGYHIVRDEPDHATRLAWPRIARVVRRPGYPAVRIPVDDPAAAPVIRAAEVAAGEPVILVPTLGGSLPLHFFVTILDQPLVVVPIANHDDNQHAPDENLRLANLWYGIDLFSAIFTTP